MTAMSKAELVRAEVLPVETVTKLVKY